MGTHLPNEGSRIKWHYAGVKVILCLPILFAAYASADEVAERVAIGRTIALLNDLPHGAGLFTEDANAPDDLERLRRVKPLTGEAAIDFPGMEFLYEAAWVAGHPQPPDWVAGVWTCDDGGPTKTTPLLFVMKKERGNWKMASLRVLA